MAKVSKKQTSLQQTWEDKISRAKDVRKKWKADFSVDLGYEYFEGKQKDSTYSDTDWITINNIYSHVKSQLPTLYDADPWFYIKLRRTFDPNPMNIVMWEKRGKVRSSMINYLKEELKLKDKMRLSIQDAFFKYGVIKTHYHSESADNPDFGKPMFGEGGEQLFGDDSNPLLEPEIIPINGRYKITRILPDDILWDEDAGSLEDDWKWIAQRIRMTLSQAKNNPNFKKLALKKLEGKGGSSDPELRARDERKKGNDVKGRSESMPEKKSGKDEDELISFWEIYNIENLTWLVIAEDGEIPVMDASKLPKGIEKHPYSILRFTLREDSAYPIPNISQGLPVAGEYNKARSDIQKHRKRFNRKYEASIQHVGSDNTDELSKLESGDDGTVIKVHQTGGILPIKDAPLDQMRYQELGFLKSEMIELLGGSSPESRGIAGADSATQAGILDKRLEVKEGDAMSMVIDFATNIARKLDQLVQSHIERDEAVKVTGPQGEFWELIRTEDYEEIAGEYQYSVNTGSTIPRLPQIERASWQAFLGLLANFPQLLLSKRFLKVTAEQHHIEDEAMVEELHQLGVQMMSGQMPQPGAQGSQAGVGEERPVSAAGGQAGGVQSLTTGNAAIQG